MKNLTFKSAMSLLVIAMMTGFISCQKTELESVDNPAPTSETGTSKSLSNNPYDYVGTDFLACIANVQSFEDNINDPAESCQIGDYASCVETFDSNEKLRHRVVHFYDSLGYEEVTLESLDVFESVLAQGPTPGDFVSSGLVSKREMRLTAKFLEFMSSHSDLATLRAEIERYENYIIGDTDFGSDAKARLLSNFAILDAGFEATMLAGGADLEDVHDVLGWECGVALIGYGAAFVGVGLATGGVGAVAAWVGFGSAIAGVFATC